MSNIKKPAVDWTKIGRNISRWCEGYDSIKILREDDSIITVECKNLLTGLTQEVGFWAPAYSK